MTYDHCVAFADLGERGAFPDDYDAIPDNEPEMMLMGGGSLIVSPLGEMLAGPHFDGECILTADLDIDDIARSKYDFDAVRHYARPDVFRLVVDENPKPVMSNSIDTAIGDRRYRRRDAGWIAIPRERSGSVPSVARLDVVGRIHASGPSFCLAVRLTCGMPGR